MSEPNSSNPDVVGEYFRELSGRIEARKVLQTTNMAACSRDSYAEEAGNLARLETSVKRNTAFVKRIRNLTEAQRDGLLKDAATLNLTKYVEEAATALLEARLKMADVGAAVTLACFLHRRYSTFSSALLAQIKKATGGKEDDLGKLRVDLRLGAELVASHMFGREDRHSKGFDAIYAAVKRIVEADIRPEPVGSGPGGGRPFLHVAIVTSFAKYFAEEYMGLYAHASTEHQQQCYPTFETFTEAETRSMRDLVVETYYLSALLPYLKERFKELATLDRSNRAIFRAKGELHPERKEKFEAANSTYQKLLGAVKTLASAIHEPLPDYALPPAGSIEDEAFEECLAQFAAKGSDLGPEKSAQAANDEDGATPKDKYIWWDDEDTANFYRDLPDLRTFVPGILFKESAGAALAAPKGATAAADKVIEPDATGENGGGSDPTLPLEGDGPERLCPPVPTHVIGTERSLEDFLALSAGTEPEASRSQNLATTAATTDTASTISSEDLPHSLKDLDDDTLSSVSNFGVDSDLEEVDPEEAVPRPRHSSKAKAGKKKSAAAAAAATTGSNLMKVKMDAFLTSLPTKINRDLIDEAATTFVMDLNTKINRKRLVVALLSVPRSRTDLLPFYARLAAALNPCMPDLGRELGKRLYSSFRYQLRKKDQVNLETKLKIVRFVAELVKFGLFAPLEACYAAFLLISDLRHHNIEMVAALLEACGRYLFNRPETRQRAKFLLESLMRKKSALALDPRYVTLIENAYYYCLPDTVGGSSAGGTGPLSDAAYEATLTPERRYLRHLLYHDLNSATPSSTGGSGPTVDRIVRALRRLRWDHGGGGDDSSLPLDEFFVDTALSLSRFGYDAFPALARLVSTLDMYHGSIGILVVDTLLERLRLGSEVSDSAYDVTRDATGVGDVTAGVCQGAVAAAKFLGEAYNYRLVDSGVVFRALYPLIGDGNEEGPPDPPANLFRLRLALTLLEACGVYFDRGTSKKRLDYFLIFFQNYYLSKKAAWDENEVTFPIDVTNFYRDVMDLLKPKMKLFQDLEESRAAIKVVQEEYMEQINAQMKKLLSDANQSSLPPEHLVPNCPENVGADDFCQRFSHLHPIDEEVTSGEENLTQDGSDQQASSYQHDHLEQEQRTQENVKVQNLDISLPALVRDKTEKLAAAQGIEDPSLPNTTNGDPAPSRPPTMEFVLVCKKGNKPLYKDVQIPYDSRLALRIKTMEEAERREKEQMKKLTLKINKIQEEEDYKAEVEARQLKQLKLQEEMRQNLYRANLGPPDTTFHHYHHHAPHQHHGGRY